MHLLIVAASQGALVRHYEPRSCKWYIALRLDAPEVVLRPQLALKHAISKGKRLESLKVYVTWIPMHTPESVFLVHETPSERFGKVEARKLMFREDDGCRNIRLLSVGPQTYVVSFVFCLCASVI